MSDKSKLGFNINPKNYDELNSTDNLITSGSDSGWLGKKWTDIRRYGKWMDG